MGPWSADTLPGSAYGGVLVRARESVAAGMALARLGFDLWRRVAREPLTASVTVLGEGDRRS